MFRRQSSAPEVVPADTSAAATSAAATSDAQQVAQQPKGRATPSRKDAEAARKQSLTIPSDPKAARKAAKERARDDRVRGREALASGDERFLPPRDAGPVRAYARDYVDARISAGELFIPVAVSVLVLGFVKVAWVQQILLWIWLVMLIGVVADSLFIWWRLRATLPERFPDMALRGTIPYALMRSLQIRMLRLPKPKFRAGGKPAKARRKS